MTAQNQTERSKAFRVFLLFFILTVAIIVATIFFSVQVPLKQNNQFRQRIAAVEKEKFFAETFVNKMAETMRLLDSVNQKEVKSERIDMQIDESVARLNSMIVNDSIADKSLYMYVVTNMGDLKEAKKTIRDLTGKDANLDQLQQENARLRSELQQANFEINYYRQAQQPR